jgi:hypothetical protein
MHAKNGHRIARFHRPSEGPVLASITFYIAAMAGIIFQVFYNCCRSFRIFHDLIITKHMVQVGFAKAKSPEISHGCLNYETKLVENVFSLWQN